MASKGLKAGPTKGGALKYRRVVVKAGTGILTGGKDYLDEAAMAGLVRQVAELRKAGGEAILVTSGAMATGRHILGITHRRRDIPFRQVLSAVGQSRLMQVYEQLFAPHGIHVAQALLTRGALSERLGYLNVRNVLLSLLEMGVAPIVNENDVVAVEEIGEKFGDNDRLSALVATLVDADLLAILSDIEGLHTADPHLDPTATLVRRVEGIDESIEEMAGGRHGFYSQGGMPTKLEAARLTTASGIATVICSGSEPDVVLRLARGEEIGTLFLPTASRMESRKRWMLSGLSTRGEIRVDAGAVRALTTGHGSLLPAGVVDVRGEFQRGDIVTIAGPGGERIACGITNYGCDDMARIKGTRSTDVQAALGYFYGAEVVHRNNMALL
jgi:glutamate 5-kinase